MTRILSGIVENLRRLTGAGAKSAAEMTTGSARFAEHKIDATTQAERLRGREMARTSDKPAAPEHKSAAIVEPRTVDQGGGPEATVDKRPRQAGLATELSKRAERDQEVRRNMSNPASMSELEAMRMVDADNVSWFRGVIDEHGWPGKDQVGEKGARAAWLIVQHAPLDLQQRCLPSLRQAVDEGRADRVDLAYLDDRVRTREKRPQIYGTQSFGLEGPIRLLPIENPGQVNDLRAELGLPPLEEEDIANAWSIEEISALSITY